jgi:hypothetical protein
MFNDIREAFQDLAALGALMLFGVTMLLWSDVLAELLQA